MSLIEKAVERLEGLQPGPTKIDKTTSPREQSVNEAGEWDERKRSEGDPEGVPGGQQVELDLDRLQTAGIVTPGTSPFLIAVSYSNP